MKKEYLFVAILLIGIILVITILFFVSATSNIPAYSALYISITTAVYAALTKLNPNENKRQELYGQLKKTMMDIIQRLERKEISEIGFSFWSDAKLDARYELVDKTLRKKLDYFLDDITIFNYNISQLENVIWPKFEADALIEAFPDQYATALKEIEEEPNRASFELRVDYSIGSRTLDTSIRVRNAVEQKLDLLTATRKQLREENSNAENIVISGFNLQFKFGINYECFGRGKAKTSIEYYFSKDWESIEKFYNFFLKKKINGEPAYNIVDDKKRQLQEQSSLILNEIIKRLEKIS